MRQLILLLLCFSWSTSQAQVKPFLYSITKPGQPVSFLFGTRHSPIPAEEFPDFFWRAFDSRPILAKELTDTAYKAAAKNRKPEPELPPELQQIPEPSAAAKEQLRLRGLPEYLHRSIYVCMFYQTWETNEILYVDAMLEKRALENKRQLFSLNSPDLLAKSSFDFLDSARICDIETLTTYLPAQQVVDSLRASLDRYKSGEFPNQYKCPIDSECEKETASWVPKLENIFKGGGTFIAVGQGHLGGEKGLINLFKQRRYKVEQVTSMKQVNSLIENSNRR